MSSEQSRSQKIKFMTKLLPYQCLLKKTRKFFLCNNQQPKYIWDKLYTKTKLHTTKENWQNYIPQLIKYNYNRPVTQRPF